MFPRIFCFLLREEMTVATTLSEFPSVDEALLQEREVRTSREGGGGGGGGGVSA